MSEPFQQQPVSTEASSSAIYGTLAAEVLVAKLGRALHRYGTPAHRLEEAMNEVSHRLGLQGDFFSTPTAIFASLRPEEHEEDERPGTLLMRVEPGELSLEKLSLLDALLGQVVRREVTARQASARIDEVENQPPRFGRTVTTAAFALASGSTARFFGGGLQECAVATVLGLGIGLLALAVEKLENAGRLYESVAALLAAFAATAAAIFWPPLAFWIVTVSALIVLVPGLTLTVAMTELATRNLVSGAARLSGAVLMFMTIGVGFALGNRLGILAFGEMPVASPVELPPWTELPALAVVAFALLILFRAHPRDYGWFLAAAALALYGSRAGTEVFGPQLGALVGAVLVGVASNLFARVVRRPAAIVQMPGIMLLVPGSVGFRSVAELVRQDTLSGVQTAFSMVLVAISLVTGLLLANVLLPPRNAL